MKKRLLTSLVLGLILMIASWFIERAGRCYGAGCNPGINPTHDYGFPLVFRTTSLYGGPTYHWLNLALSFVFWVALSFAIRSLADYLRRRPR